LFLDVGGVLLTNGWDHHARRRAAKHFKLDWHEMEERHTLNFVIYETDKLTLQEYLGWWFFTRSVRSRGPSFGISCARNQTILGDDRTDAEPQGKVWIEIIVLSNEARELNDYRIHQFKLDEFVDVFVSSCLVRLHKPDAAIFRLALDIALTPANQIVYIENTPMFVQIADHLGIRGLLHTDYPSTREKLAALGLDLKKEPDMKPNDSRILTINGGSSSIKFALYDSVQPLQRDCMATLTASACGERI